MTPFRRRRAWIGLEIVPKDRNAGIDENVTTSERVEGLPIGDKRVRRLIKCQRR
jgi:hypothetical protein